MKTLWATPWEKGQFEYRRARRRQQLCLALICFVIAAAFVVAGWLIWHTNRNVLMVPGLLMVLPFANFLVTYIAIADGKELLPEQHERVRVYEESGMCLFHLTEVDEKGRRQYLDCTVIYQGGLVAYCSRITPERKRETETDVILRLRSKGSPLRLKIYTDFEEYSRRLSEIAPEVPAEDVAKVERAEESLLSLCL